MQTVNWTMPRYGSHDDGYWSAWKCTNEGCRRPGVAAEGADWAIKPVFYLLPSVTYVSGRGTSSDPFIFS